MELAFEVRVPAAHEGNDDLQRLREAGKDLVLREAEIARLAGPLVAGTKAEDETAAADLVERLVSLR